MVSESEKNLLVCKKKIWNVNVWREMVVDVRRKILNSLIDKHDNFFFRAKIPNFTTKTIFRQSKNVYAQ